MIIQPGLLILNNDKELLSFVYVTVGAFSASITCDFINNTIKITPNIPNDWFRAAYKEIKT